MKKIYIDAGHNHSGADTGATGNGLLEQNITVQVAKKLEKILNQHNVETKCSRNSTTESIGHTLNESLTCRYNGANNWGADFFVSLHCDAVNSASAQGSHICIYGKGGEAEKMAKAINPYLLELGLTGRSEAIQVRTDLTVLKKTNMPAILIEMGFITNKRDSDIQRDNQDGLADAIAHGLCDYLDIVYENPKAYITDVGILIDGVDKNITGKNIDGTTYSPLRSLMSQFGYNVEWNDKSKTANIITESSVVNETTKDDKVVVDNKTEVIDHVIPPVQPTVYKTIGVTNVIEIDPRNIFHVETQCVTNKTPYDNFVNSLFFMNQSNGIMYPQGIAVNAGQVLANNPTHGKPVATLIIKGWNQVEMKYITDITKEENVWFAVSGYGVYPNITASQEGFTGKFSDVLRSTNRPIIGYRKADNKVVIAVRSGSDATRANLTAKNLGLDFAISLDAGGSTTLKQKGKYIFKGDGRKLWGGIIWG